MNHSILDPNTGSIHLPGFTLLKQTTEDEFINHYHLEKYTAPAAGWAHYTLRNIQAENYYFSMNFSFLGGTIRVISFILSKEAIVPSGTSGGDWGHTPEELEELEMYEKWLTGKLGDTRSFGWGKIEATFHKRGGGPMIYMEYN